MHEKMKSLEDLCIDRVLRCVSASSCRCQGPRRNDQLSRTREAYRDALSGILGGLSSQNVRRKMIQRCKDVRFLVNQAQECLPSEELSSAVNQIFLHMICVILSEDLSELALSCKIMSSDLQDLEDEIMYEEDNHYMDEPPTEFHLNLGEVLKHLSAVLKDKKQVHLTELDLQGCYIGRMHGGFQVGLTKMFETTDPISFSRLTRLTLRDFLEFHGTPTKRASNRIRLCKAIGNACHNLESLNLGNIDLGAAIYIFVNSVCKAFPNQAKCDNSSLVVTNQPDSRKNSVSIESSLDLDPNFLQPMCSSLQVLVLSLRDQSGTYSGLTLAPFFLQHLRRLSILHLDGLDNVVVGGLAAIQVHGSKMSAPCISSTNIMSADWFNPDNTNFNNILGLPSAFSFQDGLNLLSDKCPNLRRLTIGKTLLLEYSSPIRIPREPFCCKSLECLNQLRHLVSLTTQCIPAKYIVPVVKSIGHQLESLSIRLHMQTAGELSCGFIEKHLKKVNFNIQVTGHPLTRGDILRQEAWLIGGQDAVANIEEEIREQRLDAIFVDDY